jgi:hypothetical protein
VVTSACSLVVPRLTTTVSTTSTAPAVVITSVSTITIDVADYVPTATGKLIRRILHPDWTYQAL